MVQTATFLKIRMLIKYSGDNPRVQHPEGDTTYRTRRIFSDMLTCFHINNSIEVLRSKILQINKHVYLGE